MNPKRSCGRGLTSFLYASVDTEKFLYASIVIEKFLCKSIDMEDFFYMKARRHEHCGHCVLGSLDMTQVHVCG